MVGPNPRAANKQKSNKWVRPEAQLGPSHLARLQNTAEAAQPPVTNPRKAAPVPFVPRTDYSFAATQTRASNHLVSSCQRSHAPIRTRNVWSRPGPPGASASYQEVPTGSGVAQLATTTKSSAATTNLLASSSLASSSYRQRRSKPLSWQLVPTQPARAAQATRGAPVHRGTVQHDVAAAGVAASAGARPGPRSAPQQPPTTVGLVHVAPNKLVRQGRPAVATLAPAGSHAAQPCPERNSAGLHTRASLPQQSRPQRSAAPAAVPPAVKEQQTLKASPSASQRADRTLFRGQGKAAATQPQRRGNKWSRAAAVTGALFRSATPKPVAEKLSKKWARQDLAAGAGSLPAGNNLASMPDGSAARTRAAPGRQLYPTLSRSGFKLRRTSLRVSAASRHCSVAPALSPAAFAAAAASPGHRTLVRHSRGIKLVRESAAKEDTVGSTQQQTRLRVKVKKAQQAATSSKNAKLKRIGGHLYKVGGAGKSRSMKRQATEAAVTSTAKAPSKYARSSRGTVLVRRRSKDGTLTARLIVTPATRSASKLRTLRTAARASRQAHKADPAKTHCLTYCRTGRCSKAEKHQCAKKHDRSKVAVCPRWLQGACTDTACRLQHARRPELMPVCSFFLQGLCSNAECPYLHVNVDPAAPVCKAFLQGYCPLGAGCRNKHLTRRQIKELRASRCLALLGDLPRTQSKKRRLGGLVTPAAQVKRSRGAEQQVPRWDSASLWPAFLRQPDSEEKPAASDAGEGAEDGEEEPAPIGAGDEEDDLAASDAGNDEEESDTDVDSEVDDGSRASSVAEVELSASASEVEQDFDCMQSDDADDMQDTSAGVVQ